MNRVLRFGAAISVCIFVFYQAAARSVLFYFFGTHLYLNLRLACRNSDGHARILVAPPRRFLSPNDFG
jgi:hypothetical protein